MKTHASKYPVIESDTAAPGFQIAPMIDVVFVIMLFFMVMVGSIKVERQLVLGLPDSQTFGMNVRFPDNEVTLGVLEDGTVTMNDEVFDSPGDKALPTLTSALKRLAVSSDRQGDKLLATLQTEQQASYERIMDVLNALNVAEIKNVTFTVGAEF